MSRRDGWLTILTLLCVWIVGACSQTAEHLPPIRSVPVYQPVDEETARVVLNRVAESYVELVLALGQHDTDYVDAYYGPPELQRNAAVEQASTTQIRARAVQLLGQLRREPTPATNALLRLRYDYLLGQLTSLVSRVDMLNGLRLTFDEESSALYDAVAPKNDLAIFDAALGRLDELIPGQGTIQRRLERFRAEFVIPRERIDEVFTMAISACRSRTADYIDLPAGEEFTVEYVTDKPWSGYNWYQGSYRSIIQVNTDLPVYIDRALDLACHEGYPGHHVYNVLLEKHLVRDRGWFEFSVYPLFSPQSVIAEGSANYGIEVAFPGPDRLRFERDTLFPVAGLDPTQAERYRTVMDVLAQLDYAGNEAARQYLDGQINRQGAAAMLSRYNLMEPGRAGQRVTFFDRYRSYVINYNVGLDLVREFVESGLNDDASNQDRWQRFAELLSSPRLPSGLRGINH